MDAPRNQFTIAKHVSVTGVGYWSGRTVWVEFRPAGPETGVVFVRRDLAQPVRIPAHIDYRIDSPRRSTLEADGAQVEMVEHVLAALAGLQIDNCEVWVDAPEMPGADGSSLPFVEALDRAGLVYQDAPCRHLVVRQSLRLGDDDCWIEIHPSPTADLKVKYRLDYGDHVIGRQTLAMTISPRAFRRELAASRTFLRQEEAKWLQSQGLGLSVSPRDLLIFDDEGPIENTLRFPDECVRHKILDLVGDLALAGCPVTGHVIAHKSGHKLNADLVKLALARGHLIGPLRKTA
ncbi:MAG: UDP-3-O-[3-hydroxymyristoyl] N-acetylglucosamine deacetylase [Planctomycetia bacterium]|nr:UDP-3-O-[3-hydroxymyristoyl] N-acetylglucosamine deacetylase [Planctomycetia bacterium]